MQLVIAAMAGLVLVWYHREIAAAIENFRNNFPRGPRTPMHPMPSADEPPSRRRRVRSA